MQTADREEFEQLLATLCAGYGATVTEHRKSAYWSSLAKMSVHQFGRCVEFAISPEGPEELPPPKGIWRIHRGFRAQAPAARPEAPIDERDHLEYWANRLLYAHLASRGGLGSTGRGESARASAELGACLKFKRELVAWFLGPIGESDVDATPAEFLRQWIAGLQEVSRIEPETYKRWCELLEDPGYAKPFPSEMGRALVPA